MSDNANANVANTGSSPKATGEYLILNHSKRSVQSKELGRTEGREEDRM